MKIQTMLFTGVTAAGMFIASQATANEPVVIDIEPGKWQHTFRIESESGAYEDTLAEARRQLESLPEAQRQMVEQMMAQQGISLDSQGGSMEVCVTQEEINEGFIPQQEGCSQTLSPKSGTENVYQVNFSCEADGTEGIGEFTIVDRQNYNAVIDAVVTMQGQPEMITLYQSGQHLGACDN